LIGKVKEGQLALSGYKLEAKHFTALKMAFKIEPALVIDIRLNECGLSEEGFLCLVQALKELSSLKTLRVT
jgi:hypothetical protein